MKIKVDEDEFWPYMCEYKYGVEIEITEQEYMEWHKKFEEFLVQNKVIKEKYEKALNEKIRRQQNDVSDTRRCGDEETREGRGNVVVS